MSGGLILAAPASGSGKTTLTTGLLRLLRRQGRSLASAKLGPDYIDPAFHAMATGAPCRNLDPWAMRPATLAALVARLEAAAELVLCEGAMGLFDGAGIAGAHGSTADLAAMTGWPVVLVVDAAGQAASAAALLHGFNSHRAEVSVAGAIFNRVGSARHAAMIDAAVKATLPDLKRLGYLPRLPQLVLPSRHLGLVQAAEHDELERFLEYAADALAEAVDVAALTALARPAAIASIDAAHAPRTLPPLGQRIAVARDIAFAFAYPALLEGWHDAGAALTFFSPLADEAPSGDADAVFLPGGYPELHAQRLAGATRFKTGLAAAARRAAVIYGECGGYMALGQGLIDAGGEHHAMAGLLPLVTSFKAPQRHLGYRVLRLLAGGPLGLAGARYRGHEFHYASLVEERDAAPLFAASDADGEALGTVGLSAGRVAGSFIHLIDQA